MKNDSRYVYMIDLLEKDSSNGYGFYSSVLENAFEFSDVLDYLDNQVFSVNNRVVQNIVDYARRQQNSLGA